MNQFSSTQLNDFPLFHGLKKHEIEEIFFHTQCLNLAAEEWLIKEGDAADRVFLIIEGKVAVLKKETDKHHQLFHHLTTLKKGDSIGEMALLDHSPRSASVKTIAPTTLFVLMLADLQRLPENISRTITNNIGKAVCQRLRYTNEITVTSLKETLKQTKLREQLGRFLVNTVTLLCIYTFSVAFISELVDQFRTDLYASLLLLVGLIVPIIIAVKRNPYSWDFYGVTLHHWRRAIYEGILYTIPFLLLIILIKGVIIQTIPFFYEEALFNGKLIGSDTPSATIMSLFLLVIYILCVPAQEFVVRGVMQSSLSHLLTGKYATLQAIIVSNLIFSTFHLYLSFSFALMTFIPGLFWGWLYAKHKTLLGAIISHILLGTITLYFIGIKNLLIS